MHPAWEDELSSNRGETQPPDWVGDDPKRSSRPLDPNKIETSNECHPRFSDDNVPNGGDYLASVQYEQRVYPQYVMKHAYEQSPFTPSTTPGRATNPRTPSSVSSTGSNRWLEEASDSLYSSSHRSSSRQASEERTPEQTGGRKLTPRSPRTPSRALPTPPDSVTSEDSSYVSASDHLSRRRAHHQELHQTILDLPLDDKDPTLPLIHSSQGSPHHPMQHHSPRSSSKAQHWTTFKGGEDHRS